MRIHDISQSLSPAIAVWPGDQPFQLGWSMRLDQGDSVNVAAITMSVHTGTHTDGGFHVNATGAHIGDVPLDPFIGRATVVDARGLDALDERVLERFDPTQAERVLFRTRAAVDEREFPDDYRWPSEGLVERLVAVGVKLLGTDAPSMDAFGSQTLDTHHALIRGNIAILENLVLTGVAPGEYTLIALPLKLIDADSSPVRAVLVEAELR